MRIGVQRTVPGDLRADAGRDRRRDAALARLPLPRADRSRELIGEYRAMIEGAVATLSEETYGRGVEQDRARLQGLIQQHGDGGTRAAMQGEAR